MGNIKKRSNRAYILLESLLTLSLLAMITSVMLTEISRSQKQSKLLNQQIETLNLAKMAMDKNVSNLSGNEVAVRLERSKKTFEVSDQSGKELLELEVLEMEK